MKAPTGGGKKGDEEGGKLGGPAGPSGMMAARGKGAARVVRYVRPARLDEEGGRRRQGSVRDSDGPREPRDTPAHARLSFLLFIIIIIDSSSVAVLFILTIYLTTLSM